MLAALGCVSQNCGSNRKDREIGADGGSDSVPFDLVSASLNASEGIVVLHFSEPVAPVDGVNPNDFRISYAAHGAVQRRW